MKPMIWISPKKVLLFIFPALLFACEKQDIESDVKVLTDAFVIKKKIDGQEKWATAYHAIANTSLKSVTVTPVTGLEEPFELNADTISYYFFFKDPEDEDFKTFQPYENEWQFEVVTKDDMVIQQMDYLEKVELDIPVITSTIYFSIGNTLKVHCPANEKADGIEIKLFNNKGEIAFQSDILSPTSTEFLITGGTRGWYSTVVSGDKLTLQVHAIAFESNSTEENRLYNIATKAITERNIIWGK